MTKRFNVFIRYSRKFDLQAAINLLSQLESAGLAGVQRWMAAETEVALLRHILYPLFSKVGR